MEQHADSDSVFVILSLSTHVKLSDVFKDMNAGMENVFRQLQLTLVLLLSVLLDLFVKMANAFQLINAQLSDADKDTTVKMVSVSLKLDFVVLSSVLQAMLAKMDNVFNQYKIFALQ